jgi:general secretion pathway protein F
MPIFHYKAANPNGEILEGEMQAADQHAVIRQLQAEGHIPIRAEEGARPSTIGAELDSILNRHAFSARELSEFTLELATFLEAGVPLDKALGMLVELSVKPSNREILSRLHGDVHGGADLSRAMASQDRVF